MPEVIQTRPDMSRALSVALLIGRYSILAGFTLVIVGIVSALLLPPPWLVSIVGLLAGILLWGGVAVLVIAHGLRKLKVVR